MQNCNVVHMRHDEPMAYKQKSDSQTIQNLHLNVLLDNFQNKKCIVQT